MICHDPIKIRLHTLSISICDDQERFQCVAKTKYFNFRYSQDGELTEHWQIGKPRVTTF